MPQANVSYTIVRTPTTVVEKEQIGSVRKVRYPEAGVRHVFASLIGFADLGVAHLQVRVTAGTSKANVSYTSVRIHTMVVEIA